MYAILKSASWSICWQIVRVRPMIDQIEHTPFMHDEKLLGFCRENEIQVMAWGPLLREIRTRMRLAGWLRDIIRRLLSYCCVGMSSGDYPNSKVEK